MTNRIQASGDVGTVIITVRVSDADPDVAKRLADAVAAEFGPLVDELDNAGRTNPLVRIIVITPPTETASGGIGLSRLLLLGLALGLLLGFSYAAVRELFNARVRTADDLAELTGLPTLGTIPFDAKANALYTGKPGASAPAEAMRKVRTIVQHDAEAAGKGVLLVASPGADEGRSTVAANLALQLTNLNHRVVLVDADMRQPALNSLLDVPASPGLAELLEGSATLDEALILRAPEGQSHGLWVIPGGTPQSNPADLLASAEWDELLTKLKERFDHVVIDSPAVTPYTDAVAAATNADSVLLVARAERSNRDQVRAAVRTLQAVSAPLVGTVLTMAKGR